MVDGSPMDSATHLDNDAHCLDRHLKDGWRSMNGPAPRTMRGVGPGT